MPLRIKCPAGHTLIVPDDRAGRTLTCPRCDQSVVVPSAKAAPARSSVAVMNSEPPVQEELLALIARDVGRSQASVGVADKVDLRRNDDVSREASRQPSYEDQPTRPVVKPKSRALPQLTPPPQAPPPALAPMPAPQEAPPPQPVLLSESPSLEQPTEEHEQPEKRDKSNFESSPAAPIEAPPLPDEEAAPDLARSAHIAAEPMGSVGAAPAGDVVSEPLTELAPLPEEPAPPPFVPRPEPATVNLHADAASTLAVYQLVAALVAAAAFSVVPAVWDLVEYLQVAESQFVARWALGLFFLGTVQLAYAVYLFQLPDWTTVWVVTMFSLFVAAIYAAVLGLVLLSPADGFLVGDHGLQLADKLASGKAALWCLCMVSLLAIVAFFSGRLSTRWHKTEMLLRACG